MPINFQLEELYIEDKAEREKAKSKEEIDNLIANTKIRLNKLRIILPNIDESEIWNCHYAAYLLQHGEGSADFELAHDYAKKAVDMGSNVTKWLYAATLDRLLISQGKLQKFGTQYQIIGGKKVYAPTDQTVTDAEKKEYGVL